MSQTSGSDDSVAVQLQTTSWQQQHSFPLLPPRLWTRRASAGQQAMIMVFLLENYCSCSSCTHTCKKKKKEEVICNRTNGRKEMLGVKTGESFLGPLQRRFSHITPFITVITVSVALNAIMPQNLYCDFF